MSIMITILQIIKLLEIVKLKLIKLQSMLTNCENFNITQFM